MIFHKRLKFLLEKKSISQRDFAKMLDISPARLNNYINGKTEPNYLIINQTVQNLDCTADFLLGLKNNFVPSHITLNAFDFGNSNEVYDLIHLRNNSLKPFKQWEICERIKHLLKHKRMTQAKLAKLLDIPVSRLNTYLSGSAEAGCETIKRMAEIFEVSADYLLGLTQDASPTSPPKHLHSTFKGISATTGAAYVNIFVYDISGHIIGGITCAASIKNRYVNPYFVKADDSMEPVLNEGDLVLVAPQKYIKPVLNNLCPNTIYAVRSSLKDTIGLTLRYCLTYDYVMFLRPVNLNYQTNVIDLNSIDYSPTSGITICAIRANKN